MKSKTYLNPVTADKTTRRRWMVVDDDAGVRGLLTALLISLGNVDVSAYSNGAEALVALSTTPEAFQFVVTDLEMPAMSGIEFCRHVHARQPQLRVLLTTGSEIISRREALDLGFCGLLNKPFPLADLRQTLSTAGLLATPKLSVT
jgi:CheY-like chemotaxis protein